MERAFVSVQTEFGFKSIWDVAIGDNIVLADGSLSSISATIDSEQVTHLVTFKDGRTAQIGEDQLLRVFQHSWMPESTKWRVHPLSKVMSTYPTQIYKCGSKVQKNQRHVQLTSPYAGADIELPLHPYVLGALLGDGSLGRSVSFTSADQSIADDINTLVPQNSKITKKSATYAYGFSWSVREGNPGPNPVSLAIESLGLKGTVSNTKFIPDIYMTASTPQRIALLQGLMDTDGTIDTQKSCSFCSVSKIMAEQVQLLVRSIGGIAVIGTRTPSFTYLGIKKKGQLAYQVNIRIADSSLLFRLPRKLDRVGGGNQYSNRLRLEVKSIDPIGLRQVRTLALPVEDPLYVLGDFIVIHGLTS